MKAIGIDTHKATLAACVDRRARSGRSRSGPSPTTRPGHAALLAWALAEAPGATGSAWRARQASARPPARFLLAAGRVSRSRCRRSSAIASGCAPAGPARAIPVTPSRSPG